MRQGVVEQGAAGVGVDLDQLRTVVAEVEVEAHERAPRAMIALCDRRRAAQRLGAEAGQGDDGVDGGDELGHGLQGGGGDEHRGGREQVRAAVGDVRREPEQGGLGFELTAQAFAVQTAAGAMLVEGKRKPGCVARGWEGRCAGAGGGNGRQLWGGQWGELQGRMHRVCPISVLEDACARVKNASADAPAPPQAEAGSARSYQRRVRVTIFTSHSITGTSISTPTTVASAAPESKP